MGREIQVSKDGKPYATMRVFLAGGRFYEVVAVSNYGPSDPASNAFLYSFHALDAHGAVTNDIAPAAPASSAPSSPHLDFLAALTLRGFAANNAPLPPPGSLGGANDYG